MYKNENADNFAVSLRFVMPISNEKLLHIYIYFMFYNVLEFRNVK